MTSEHIDIVNKKKKHASKFNCKESSKLCFKRCPNNRTKEEDYLKALEYCESSSFFLKIFFKMAFGINIVNFSKNNIQ